VVKPIPLCLCVSVVNSSCLTAFATILAAGLFE
jgi:hypothetical protein